ncbi:Asp-tRNAAsn/Glu-tRNAGln amidotransferase A subunit [Bellilinea caldifistulae]|uniref:amidase n=1 Tax=Bellilinea caldifistulae TaxID=360411 RepID=UPI0007866488|nr:amidase [Bellilinea caldifistulae]GAP09321.1 Asp-tRNAAsn/Glu-tRNAGln amidotransferase A subunit [Bellilinea caldifistulae]
MNEEIVRLSASELARRIRRKQISAREVIEAHLLRIEQVNPGLNAVVALSAEEALAQAVKADATLARGEAVGPLHGVPFTVKDWIDAAGLPCTGGEARYKNRIPVRDASVVSRMRQAGAILLGKTNVMVENEVYGRTHNPYNPAYSPCGSSSGEAAIIAACGSPLGLGSDSGGSIRQPAHACGITGLKPTTGRLPLTGHFPFISAMNDPRTTIGPMARFVEDLALVLPVLSGVDWQDASVIPMPLADWRQVKIDGLRVAFYTHHAEAEPTPETAAACRRAARLLAEHGAQVEENLPPRIEEAYEITRQYWARVESEDDEEWVSSSRSQLDGDEVARHLFIWDRFRRAMIGFMARQDVILTPAAELPAQPHGQPEGRIPYTLPYSLTGYPAVVVRCATSPEGMPIGVQVVARPWREDVALAVAHLLEQTLGGWQPPPL